MSHIAELTGNDDKFGSIADDYLSKWQTYAINSGANPPHTTLSYGDNSSHGGSSIPLDALVPLHPQQPNA